MISDLLRSGKSIISALQNLLVKILYYFYHRRTFRRVACPATLDEIPSAVLHSRTFQSFRTHSVCQKPENSIVHYSLKWYRVEEYLYESSLSVLDKLTNIPCNKGCQRHIRLTGSFSFSMGTHDGPSRHNIGCSLAGRICRTHRVALGRQNSVLIHQILEHQHRDVVLIRSR